MKKIIFSILGAVGGGALCILVAWILGAAFGPLYEGEDEATRNFKIFLGAFFVLIVAGALAGYRIGKKATN